MHVAAAFKFDDRDELIDFVTARGAGLLLTSTGRLEVTTMPFLHQESANEWGELHGHVANVNPQARLPPGRHEALVTFFGVDGYVSPSNYPSKEEHGKVVPTWNYETVHARGWLTTIDDGDWLKSHLEQLTDKHESSRTNPWTMADAPTEYIERLVKSLVGIRIELTGMQGKKKLSLNRPLSDRFGVVTGLADQHPSLSAAVRRAIV